MQPLTRRPLILAALLNVSLWGSPIYSHADHAPDTADAPAHTASQTLNAALQAHGGLDAWRRYKRMDYTTKDFPLGANAPFDFTQTTDLHNRRHLTKGEGFTAGKNDNQAWAHPSVEALGIPPAFFEEGNFYFIAMPFVFADPGAVARDIEPLTLNGKSYKRVAVTYSSNVGDSPEDDYVLYIDPATHTLHMIDFVVTSAEVNDGTPIEQLPRKALVFDNWQNADGLLVPAGATFYGWADGQLQGDGNTYTIHKVNFTTKTPNKSLFNHPNN